jgi:CRP/FNR family cyclic AMP-dependent transcriptional regulator
MWEGEIPLPVVPPWTEISVVAGLDEAVLRSACRRRHFARGEIVFHEGDPAGAIHLLDRGWAAVSLTGPLGDVVAVEILQRGDTFGEQALVDRAAVRSATVTALGKLETLAMDIATAERLRAENRGFDRFLLTILSARLRATNQQLLEALYLPAEVRVFRCLCRLAAIFDSQACIPLTQHDIGTMTGVNRSTVSRLLRQAQLDGIVVVTRSRLEIRDPQTLRRRASLRPA